jgi:hypothetical protein
MNRAMDRRRELFVPASKRSFALGTAITSPVSSLLWPMTYNASQRGFEWTRRATTSQEITSGMGAGLGGGRRHVW